MSTADPESERRLFEQKQARRWVGWALVAWVVTFLAVRAYVAGHGGYLTTWDAAWYETIAQRGYVFDGNIARQQSVAFLPAYPYVLRLLLMLGLSSPVAVTLLCAGSAVGGVALLHGALSAKVGPTMSAKACVLLVASPFSFYFLNGYSESLFLLAAGAFWWALLRRQDQVLAALFAGLAGLVRPFGIVLALVWAVDVVLHARRAKAPLGETAIRLVAYGPVAIMGPLMSCLYYAYRFGDLFLYRNILIAWGDNILTGGPYEPFDHLRFQWRMLMELHPTAMLSWAPELARLMLWASLATVVATIRRLPPQLVIYALGLIAFCFCATLGGANLGRHLATDIALPLAVTLLLFPATAAATDPSSWRRIAFAAIVLASFAIQMSYAALQLHAGWVS